MLRFVHSRKRSESQHTPAFLFIYYFLFFQITPGKVCGSLCRGKQIISNDFQNKTDSEHYGIIFGSPFHRLKFQLNLIYGRNYQRSWRPLLSAANELCCPQLLCTSSALFIDYFNVPFEFLNLIYFPHLALFCLCLAVKSIFPI